jgi:CheY-like chemotaxis protein
VLTAANGHEGLRLFMSQPVDAIVLEYHLGLLDGAAIAHEIKHVRPDVPIVMLADRGERTENPRPLSKMFSPEPCRLPFSWMVEAGLAGWVAAKRRLASRV